MVGTENLLTIAGAAVVGGGISIGSKIIFDWLRKRNGNIISGTEYPVMLSDCRTRRKEISEWKEKIDKCLVQHKGMVQEHEKRLNKGGKDFEDIKKDIAGLNTSYAVLAERVQKVKE